MRARYALLISLTMALSGAAKAEQQHTPLLSLPQLNQCRSGERPHLPEKWRAVYLMAPFTNEQLAVGEITHDDSVAATRMKVLGVRKGSLDLLVHGSNTYVLQSQDSKIAHCENVGDTGLRPLPRAWLTQQSQCAGTAPVGEVEVDWWKTPIDPAPASYWVWYKTADRTPFRLVFQAPNNRLGILSQYALSYQVRFSEVERTDLADIVNACSAAKSTPSTVSLEDRLAALSAAPDRADGALREAIPELSTCSAESLPAWPERLALTGLMTPFDSNEDPYPTEVLYDWHVPGLRTRIFMQSQDAVQDALLLDGGGYNVTYRPGQGPTCTAVLPGAIRPNWASRGPCSCEASIAGATPLTPDGRAHIFACPLASPRAAWAWYSTTGRPFVFMVTSLAGDEGRGLFAVLDYREWRPGYPARRSAFDKPKQCTTDSRHSTAPGHCATCHLGAGASP